jgi:phage-related protein
MRIIAIAFALALSACSTVESTIDGTGGIIKGVSSDVFGITAGVLDVTSNVIKDVADKTGTAATAPEETK